MKSFKDFLKEAENVIIDIRDKGYRTTTRFRGDRAKITKLLPIPKPKV